MSFPNLFILYKGRKNPVVGSTSLSTRAEASAPSGSALQEARIVEFSKRYR